MAAFNHKPQPGDMSLFRIFAVWHETPNYEQAAPGAWLHREVHVGNSKFEIRN
jgi:hypothetical protein